MNEMELLRELAQDTPLPAAAELDAARARLVAAIAADPAAGRFTPVSEVPMYQPNPSSGPAVGPLRPPAPAPVLGAVKLMYGGAVGTVVQLIIALAYIGDIKAHHLTVLGHHLTTAQLSHLRPLIATLAIGVALAVIVLWLWTARAAGQGKNWSRILSTVLFGLATLQLSGLHGIGQVFWAMLTWLIGLAAVWQLRRPASRAFFESARAFRSRPRRVAVARRRRLAGVAAVVAVLAAAAAAIPLTVSGGDTDESRGGNLRSRVVATWRNLGSRSRTTSPNCRQAAALLLGSWRRARSTANAGSWTSGGKEADCCAGGRSPRKAARSARHLGHRRDVTQVRRCCWSVRRDRRRRSVSARSESM